MPVELHDIDLQTGKAGAYAIEDHFREYVVQPVRFLESTQIRSHFGSLLIDGIRVEIMGAVQKRLDDGSWEAPVQVEHYRRWVFPGEFRAPDLSLAYEYHANLKLDRFEQAQRIKDWLDRNQTGTG